MTIADDPRGQSYVAAFQEALQKLGWAEGRNVRIDTRWPAARGPTRPNWSNCNRT